MDINLLNLEDQLRAIGRGVVLVNDNYDGGAWDFASALELSHLGDTEGEITLEVDEAYSELTLTELTGPIAHERYIDGYGITVNIPIFLADPALRAVVSPTGSASGGNSRQRKVKEHTLVIMPEQLFLNPDGTTAEVSWTGAAWQKDGQALTADEQDLLDMSVWLWRGSFTREIPAFAHADGGKSVTPISFLTMFAGAAPEGHKVHTLGDPEAQGIDLNGGS